MRVKCISKQGSPELNVGSIYTVIDEEVRDCIGVITNTDVNDKVAGDYYLLLEIPRTWFHKSLFVELPEPDENVEEKELVLVKQY